ncbi:amine oxidase [flavin-containing]-like [Babylonia areolata]|uniref:amine oxidase [flavin-containing]-like n=1 Tax=Babylonia areolata TaxID=304850 RepID=UPI003FCF81D0
MATTKQESTEVDVVVVGAGLSGLSAGKLLSEHGQRVLVLEARDRAGGRTYTVQNEHTGQGLDLGGAYVGPTQNRLLRLARLYGVETYLTNEKEDMVIYSRNKQIRFRDSIFPVTGGPLTWLDLNNVIRLMYNMCREVPVAAPWKAARAREWDRMTVQQFFDKHIYTRAAMDNAKTFVNVNVTSEPYEVSLLWFLWYLASAGGPLRINATTNGGQERKFVGGSQQISEGLARSIGTDNVLLGHPVSRIQRDTGRVVLTDVQGNTYSAGHCIMALTPTLQSRIHWFPPLPASRNQMMQRLPMGSVIKTFMYYSTPFWRHKGMCGSAVIHDEEGLVSVCLDHVMHDGTFPAIMGFVLSDTARACSTMSVEERKRRISQAYAKAFQSAEALHPVHYEEKNWCEDEWSGGCYTVMMPPGFLTTFGQALRQPVGRVHFAGTETATQWTGYMEGAIQAGERAAREILHLKGLISTEEIWQDEPEDEEIKAQPLDLTLWEKVAPSVPGFLRILCFVTMASSCVAWKLCRHRFL